MHLSNAVIQKYKSITGSTEMRLGDTVTCLVGKNESGKTALLEALYRLNPLPMGHKHKFNGLYDYPRRLYNRELDEVPETAPITARFDLTPSDKEGVERLFGKKALRSNSVEVERTYENDFLWQFDIDESAAINHIASLYNLPSDLASGADNLKEVFERAKPYENVEEVSDFLADFSEYKSISEGIIDTIRDRLPKFLYFDEYSIMPGRVSIPRLQQSDPGDLKTSERTALSLLRLANVDAKQFNESDYEARKAALEAAANQISDEVFEYWSQNQDLEVELDVDFKAPPNDLLGDPPFLELRIRNLKHRVTLNFGERSHGFMWFFSFLAAFSEYEDSAPVILLLDEPGLSLHAAAQSDLLRFIDERLASSNQVIYTTHSPFMVEPSRMERVRTVEDQQGVGTQVTKDVFTTSKDTRFPLQAALGYDLAQSLFVGPDNLIVEGPADYIYIQVISEYLRSVDRTSLDSRWVIVPVGGLDKLPTFIALLGTQLNVAVLLEESSGGTQKIDSLVRQGIIGGDKILPLSQYTGQSEADIEDMFEIGFYLKLLRDSGAASVTKAQLRGKGRIIKKIESASGGKFNHYKPARYLLENQGKVLRSLEEETLRRFERLFTDANNLLSG